MNADKEDSKNVHRNSSSSQIIDTVGSDTTTSSGSPKINSTTINYQV